jgi:hypothetical protein
MLPFNIATGLMGVDLNAPNHTVATSPPGKVVCSNWTTFT